MTNRFARHAGIPGWDQDALAAARVVIVGLGALGNEVARLLALAGVGDLLICDHDVVEESNLSRSTLFRASDIGRPKVEAARDALAELGPNTTVEARATPLQSGVGLGELRAATLVISCLDSRAARLQLTRRCGLAGAGMLNAGTTPWGGELCYYSAGEACYSCGMSAAHRAADDPAVGCAVPGPASSAPALPASAPVSALIGSWQATAAVRLLCGLPVPPSVTRIDNGFDVHTVHLNGIDPTCRWHDPVPAGIVRATSLTTESTVREVLSEAGHETDVVTPVQFPRPDGPGRSRVLARADPEAQIGELGVAPGEWLELVGARSGCFLQIKGYW